MGGKRRTLEEVKDIYRSKGLTIIKPTDYKTTRTKLDCYDNLGYKYNLPLMNIKMIKQFSKFEKTNPHTIDNIKLWLKLNAPEYELISDKYEGNENKLIFKLKSRPDLEPYEASWHSFSRGCRHPQIAKEAYGDNRRHTPETVREIIDTILKEEYNNNWTLNEGEECVYKTQDCHLKFTHNEGYISKSSLSLLKEAMLKKGRIASLEIFNVNFPEESMHNLKLWVEKNTPYRVKSGQIYTKFKDKYVFICVKHGEFEKAFHSMYSYGTQCFGCYCESVSGKGNPMYNHDLTEEERNNKRETEEYLNWRKDVLKRDQYTCQKCGDSTSGNIIAHHLDGFHWAKEKRTDVANGVALCTKCHSEFHSIYGYRHNTIQQFEEYKKRSSVG